ncbi:MAG TPA: serine/threonine-protein kinase [Candidatus Acidoferrum sp.]|nr:serine/threonine-protein kinase [Candidatus Acidoferrum sp.]
MTLYKPGVLVGDGDSRYRLGAQIGQGNFSQVFTATDTALHAPRVLKILTGTADPDRIAAFIQEGRRQAQLMHPGVLLVMGLFFDNGTPILVTPPMERSLRALFNAQPGGKNLEDAWWLAALIDTLQYVHQEGVAHLDIKPENVLLGRYEQQVCLCDFGISKVLDSIGGKTIDQTGTANHGTIDYLSPEQLNKQSPGYASDQYSVAAMLYEWLSGSTLFPGNMLETLQGHLHKMPDMRLLHPSTPQHAVEALSRALSKKPGDRFANIGDFYQALTGQKLPATAIPAGAPIQPSCPFCRQDIIAGALHCTACGHALPAPLVTSRLTVVVNPAQLDRVKIVTIVSPNAVRQSGDKYDEVNALLEVLLETFEPVRDEGDKRDFNFILNLPIGAAPTDVKAAIEASDIVLLLIGPGILDPSSIEVIDFLCQQEAQRRLPVLPLCGLPVDWEDDAHMSSFKPSRTLTFPTYPFKWMSEIVVAPGSVAQHPAYARLIRDMLAFLYGA